MSEEYEPGDVHTPVPAGGYRRVGVVDLLAFLGVLAFTGWLIVLLDPAGHLDARLIFVGAGGLVTCGTTTWRRLRQPELRRWRNGQAAYCGGRMTVTTTWGVEGQPPTVSQPPTSEAQDGPR
jgi:hypothetical protein